MEQVPAVVSGYPEYGIRASGCPNLAIAQGTACGEGVAARGLRVGHFWDSTLPASLPFEAFRGIIQTSMVLFPSMAIFCFH